MSVSQMPAPRSDRQLRPIRPRPAVWASATITVPASAPPAANSCATSSVELTSSNRRIFAALADKDEEVNDRQRDAVPAEHPEVVLLDVRDEPLDGGDRDEEADDESDAERRHVLRDRGVVLHELQSAGREHRRYGEHEGELDDRALAHADQHAADDRR